MVKNKKEVVLRENDQSSNPIKSQLVDLLVDMVAKYSNTNATGHGNTKGFLNLVWRTTPPYRRCPSTFLTQKRLMLCCPSWITFRIHCHIDSTACRVTKATYTTRTTKKVVALPKKTNSLHPCHANFVFPRP